MTTILQHWKGVYIQHLHFVHKHLKLPAGFETTTCFLGSNSDQNYGYKIRVMASVDGRNEMNYIFS